MVLATTFWWVGEDNEFNQGEKLTFIYATQSKGFGAAWYREIFALAFPHPSLQKCGSSAGYNAVDM